MKERLKQRFKDPKFLLAISAVLIVFAVIQMAAAMVLLPAGASWLDSVMLRAEIPRSAGELTALITPAAAPVWKQAIVWDFVFIAGYTVLLLAIHLGSPALEQSNAEEDYIGARLPVCAAVAATADVIENFALLIVLGDMERGISLIGTRAFTALPVAGALKWLFYFLACRALAYELGAWGSWRWMRLVLGPFSAAGAWATAFAFAGLPARPIMVLSVYVTAAILVVASVRLAAPTKGEPAATLPVAAPEPIRLSAAGPSVNIMEG